MRAVASFSGGSRRTSRSLAAGVTSAETDRCRAVRWLLRADRFTPTSVALRYIVDDLFYRLHRRQLYNNYVDTLQRLLFAVVPDHDCVLLIVAQAELTRPFGKAFGWSCDDAA